jgi:hypothetical protein
VPLVVGLAAALLLAIGVVVGIVVARDGGESGSGGSGAATAGQPGAGGPADGAAGPGAAPGSAPSATSGPGSGPPGGESAALAGGFRTAPELCLAGDFSPVFAILPQREVLNDHEQSEPDLYLRSCVFTLGDGSSLGRLSIDVIVPDGRGAAERWYEDVVAAEADGHPAREPVDGDWDESTFLIPPTASTQADVRVLARDGVLVVNLSAFVVGEAADVGTLRASLAQVADGVRDAMRS